MVRKDLQTLNLKFDQVVFNNLVFTWEGNFEETLGIFSVSNNEFPPITTHQNVISLGLPIFGSFSKLLRNIVTETFAERSENCRQFEF